MVRKQPQKLKQSFSNTRNTSRSHLYIREGPKLLKMQKSLKNLIFSENIITIVCSELNMILEVASILAKTFKNDVL